MKRKVLINTIKKDRDLLILFLVLSAVNLAVFLLYHVLIEAFWYAQLIGLAFVLAVIVIDFVSGLRKEKEFRRLTTSFENGIYDLPENMLLAEKEYKEIIHILSKRISEMEKMFDEERSDMSDWYTLWVHQIKTPIAVLKLKIPDSEKDALNELFRIEEYANMALSYIRLGSSQNDLVIKEYSLDELLRETFRKYAAQFIAKKISLEYEPTDKKVVTDKKWLLCILEQLVSNAVKYTDGGVVRVTVSGDKLTIADTGVGISSEDLPRIFEKGYTGLNGRAGAGSSGLGLYLSAKAARLIGVKLFAESVYGNGSQFTIQFPEEMVVTGDGSF